MPHDNPLDASLGAMKDPEIRRQIEQRLAMYGPILTRLDRKIEAGDPAVRDYLKDIACHTCGLIELLDADFDPGLSLMLLQRIGNMMAEDPAKWNRYTEEVAPGANANRARNRGQ